MIFLGLGSNLGDREQNMITATRRLDDHPQIIVQKVSSLYETEPVGFTEQPAFLNAVVSITTGLDPIALLAVCLSIEQQLGRIRAERWGPRTIDIDILLYNEFTVKDSVLELPHPRMKERNFVLIPLEEIAGTEPLYQGKTVRTLIEENTDDSPVLFYKRMVWKQEG
ncbi:hypothetical protein P22_2159 [Propionispora sp. 2/2-37]|uniref:2-amino-4-hydroxy-6- hydroxymethyldihydropteridine diphosphokinase n=1 Tax=Propionispora sp. 2/2-37 TaxID=1677858 RepID=UPI0006BB9497|nr:2-amino-4-hydroxy-6-hydroxymethyldihydropteridine diphosphokinase [Propionispora sp. 2/2-37]CUH96071.1 hypothetical protein P22_2159 [Propionispora sp. 2/2-37]